MPDDPKNWWTTFPGVLTALAGLITAIAGLCVVFVPKTPAASASQPSTASSQPSVSQPASPSPGSISVPTVPPKSDSGTIILPRKPAPESNEGSSVPSSDTDRIKVEVNVNGAALFAQSRVTYDYSGDRGPEGVAIRVCARQDNLKFCSKPKQAFTGHGSLIFVVALEESGGLIGSGTQMSIDRDIDFEACFSAEGSADFACSDTVSHYTG